MFPIIVHEESRFDIMTSIVPDSSLRQVFHNDGPEAFDLYITHSIPLDTILNGLYICEG